MNVLEAVSARWSVRSFESKSVEHDKVRAVLDAGLAAPSARNLQDWRFIVVTDADKRAALCQATKNMAFVSEAPVVIVACGTGDHVMTSGHHCYPIDVACAVDHMTLVATELGLGTCWVGAFYPEKVREALSIPADVHVVAMLALGYPRVPSGGEKTRRPFEQSVAFNGWTWNSED